MSLTTADLNKPFYLRGDESTVPGHRATRHNLRQNECSMVSEAGAKRDTRR